MTTASVLQAVALTTAEIAAAAVADAAAGKVGPDAVGLLESAKQDIDAANRKMNIVAGLIGAGANKTAIQAMVTAMT